MESIGYMPAIPDNQNKNPNSKSQPVPSKQSMNDAERCTRKAPPSKGTKGSARDSAGKPTP